MVACPVMRSSPSGAGSKEICRRCSRTVQLVAVGGEVVAVDPEVIAVIPSGRLGEAVPVKAAMTGRRVHAELCEGYQLADQRERHRRELAAYNRRPAKRPKGIL